ncbi:ethanolamine ammonia-lyase reactivating factor EutA [Paractinoplanes globisporus]|uniref:Ethanolamine ammonia-lyase reactivating factor EutA n=1 Tax=Paractinoplanes globisporus TaxID=113565 RepID=A0ABW6WVS5_9ACTN|nr:ethanolamine ammonia-lyase reactivating factor EutA [Actinoplanes globisporus]
MPTSDGLPDDIVLTTAGADIGSATTHFVFARIVLRRSGFTARHTVAERSVLARSVVAATRFGPGGLIDAAFVDGAYDDALAAAGLSTSDIDTGAVIVTGAAARKANARTVAEIFAHRAGGFVCAVAGDHLEARLAAYGSGAVAASRAAGNRVLNIDVGGATTKLAVIESGVVTTTEWVPVGARHTADPGPVLRAAGRLGRFDEVRFSGGVAEYIYGRESRDFGDHGRLLGAALLSRARELPGPLADAPIGIRATVIGAAQHTVRVSGSTVLADAVLPLRNLPVCPVRAPIGDETGVHRAVRAALKRAEPDAALALRWDGPPTYARLRATAAGLAAAVREIRGLDVLICLLVDGDVGRTLGLLLREEIGWAGPVVSVDGIRARELDLVDIGAPLTGSTVLPVTVKSLLFHTAEY